MVLPMDSKAITQLSASPNLEFEIYSEGWSAEETADNIRQAVERAFARLKGARPYTDSADLPITMSLGFLGDARAEKGFHILPELVKLWRKDRSPRRRLTAQIFHPKPASDVRMAKAMDDLMYAPADLVDRHLGALSSKQYREVLAASDVVFNAYDRENYIARSSGVFAEALMAGKPVITTAGTWMSGLMGDWSDPYHDEALAGCAWHGAKVFRAAHPKWRQLGAEGDAELKRALHPPGLIALAHDRTAYINVEKPLRATHLRIQVELDTPHRDQPFRVVCGWRTPDLRMVREEHFDLNAATATTISALVRAPLGSSNVWLGMTTTLPKAMIGLVKLEATWLATAEAVAFQPGGRTVPVLFSEHTAAASIDLAFCDIIENIEAYRASCDWIRERWTAFQTPQRVFNDVISASNLSPAGGDAPLRITGREWLQ